MSGLRLSPHAAGALALAALPFFAALAVLTHTRPAHADVIDGNWCRPDGSQNISIHGPSVVTPNGAHLTGNYSRHAFSYTVPSKEAGAGSTVQMVLLNPDTVRIVKGSSATANGEVWHRCALQTS